MKAKPFYAIIAALFLIGCNGSGDNNTNKPATAGVGSDTSPSKGIVVTPSSPEEFGHDSQEAPATKGKSVELQ